MFESTAGTVTMPGLVSRTPLSVHTAVDAMMLLAMQAVTLYRIGGCTAMAFGLAAAWMQAPLRRLALHFCHPRAGASPGRVRMARGTHDGPREIL